MTKSSTGETPGKPAAALDGGPSSFDWQPGELCQLIIGCAHEGVIVVDRSLRYRAWNPFMERLTDVPAREAIGRKALELFPFLARTGLPEAWTRALAGEQSPPVTFEYRGGWVSETTTPLRARSGEVIGVLSLVRDITSQKALETTLENSRNVLQTVFENMADPAWVKDTQGRFLAANKSLAHFYGLEVPDLLGKTIFEIRPEAAERMTIHDNEVVRSKGIIRTEHQLVDIHGNTNWFDTIKSPVIDHSGKVTGTVGIARNVSDWKRAEEELRNSEERLRSVWERSADGMRLTDREGRIIAVNEAFCRLVELARENLVGQVFSIVYKEQGPNDGMDVYIRRFDTGTIVPHLEARVTLWNSKELDVEISSSFIDAASQGKMVLSIFRNVTERKALEAQFRQSQKMEAIGQLAGGVAHDFNNMLAIIRGHADLLLMQPDALPAQANQSLTQIVAASQRAANLTRQLLAFSRKQAMEPRILDLNEVVKNLTRMLGRAIGEHIDLRCCYSDGLPAVEADLCMIEQVLVNLVVNSRDAMPGGGQITITLEGVSFDGPAATANSERRAGSFVCLEVSDTGHGIDPAHLSRIFDPFFTTKPLGKGSGLGLATVYGIVKQHQGWLEVDSKPGQGSTFKAYFPVCASGKTRRSHDKQAPLKGGHETILLVEDDDDVRSVTRRVMEKLGYRVFEAPNAREALRIFDQEPGIDLLVTDILLPDGICGRQLSQQLREARPRLKTIFMSGHNTDALGTDTTFVYEAPGFSIPKPCSTPKLAAAIRACLDPQ
jgi:two-component system, cell cycle sensor histidine kinase and response regulator CckA